MTSPETVLNGVDNSNGRIGALEFRVWTETTSNIWNNLIAYQIGIISQTEEDSALTTSTSITRLEPHTPQITGKWLLSYFYNIFMEMEDLKKYDVSFDCRDSVKNMCYGPE